MYINFYQITEIRGPGPYTFLCHTENIKCFSGLSVTRNRSEARIIHLARELGEIWRCSSREEVNFILIYEFKYTQAWKNWLSTLSL